MADMAFARYDWVLINSSAGKDSQAMLDFVTTLADVQGFPRARIVVVHCDLGRVEWAGTRALAQEQAAHYGLRCEVVSRPQGDLLAQVEARGMWPSSTARYCTSDQKRAQVRKVMTQLADEWRAEEGQPGHGGTKRPCRILNCMGLRAEESPARAKKHAFERDASASNGRREVDNWLPIFEWTTAEVWARIKQSGVRHHPAYDKGMKRLSCVFCIFAPQNALLIAAEHNRALLDEYVRVEAAIGHSFQMKGKRHLPLATTRDAYDGGARGLVDGNDDGCWGM